MLTDIFADRYVGKPIWKNVGLKESRLLTQCFGIAVDVLPYRKSGADRDHDKYQWKKIHDRLARELGVLELSPHYLHEFDHICRAFVCENFKNQTSADRFIKERLSFVELVMRQCHEWVYPPRGRARDNPELLLRALRVRQLRQRLDDVVAKDRETYDNAVLELNERFRQAEAPLTYHNGFIQISVDEQIEAQIAKPFWALVSDPMWTNVDIDMKAALDQRDSNSKDPAIFAAKALESAIKIISDQRKLTRGIENGAAAYVDNLVSKSNGRLIDVWEADILKSYFSKVRNSVGHGPGSEPMPTLTPRQTDWAIETAMSWVRTLVRRHCEK